MTMKVGNMQDFMGKQLSKVEQRKEEEKQIKKGIYQMKAMLASQSMETLMEEQDKAKARSTGEKTGSEESDTRTKESKKTDAQTEMEKMLSAARKGIALSHTVV